MSQLLVLTVLQVKHVNPSEEFQCCVQWRSMVGSKSVFLRFVVVQDDCLFIVLYDF
jgi:hypothetical protein